MHPSWNPITYHLYENPLLKLRDEILPNISYYPERQNIFNAFDIETKNIRVVLLGQDPYPTPQTAIGYSFAVQEHRAIPPSLRIIRQELLEEKNILQQDDLESFMQEPEWKTLKHWSKQGVLLLNTALTVEAGKAGSHLQYWKPFTDAVIRYISATTPCIWLLWGKKAQEFKTNITNPFLVKGYDNESIKEIPVTGSYNYILEAPHPAASLYGGNTSFIGCNHFYFVNEILKVNKKEKIKW